MFRELAIARGAGEMSTSNLAADALDLRHRMPLLWGAVLDLRIEVWLARKIARMARKLSKDRVGLVDAAVLSPSTSPRAGSWRSPRPRSSRPTPTCTVPSSKRTPSAPGCGSPGSGPARSSTKPQGSRRPGA